MGVPVRLMTNSNNGDVDPLPAEIVIRAVGRPNNVLYRVSRSTPLRTGRKWNDPCGVVAPEDVTAVRIILVITLSLP